MIANPVCSQKFFSSILLNVQQYYIEIYVPFKPLIELIKYFSLSEKMFKAL